jgi:hypothetical protein
MIRLATVIALCTFLSCSESSFSNTEGSMLRGRWLRSYPYLSTGRLSVGGGHAALKRAAHARKCTMHVERRPGCPAALLQHRVSHINPPNPCSESLGSVHVDGQRVVIENLEM